ncbi:fumarylacetoacetate hydrolase family protein [Aminobacter sp. MSH1]|uniref:fumarylacetoacetate hydrolase family protein n=1 Tax=Aminobacter sp. MSH1 TaxID=374606 RepID=UPI0009DC7A2C|nr:fumarylacetoacetate hydrolase family protein [Aminobacter sp. MSH1]
MKFVSFLRLGRPGFGAVTGNGIVDLTGRLSPEFISLKHAIAHDLLSNCNEYARDKSAEYSFADVTLLPVIPDPAKIICVGLNYETHRAETRRPEAKYPTIFTRFADTQIAHGQAIPKPKLSEKLDWEGEMAVVIGRGGRNIEVDSALRHVAGYACYNDITVRDWQKHTHQFIPGKNFPGTGAFGPYLVDQEEVGDYRKLPIQTRLNGDLVQDAKLSDLIFPVDELIAYCSQFTPLSAGDVILTGTPGGVGDRMDPPTYMNPGDLIEVEVGLLGTLSNRVEIET